MSNIINEIKRLQNLLLYHGYLYHTLNTPMMSDIKYDRLMHKLRFLEKKYLKRININSPTQIVGSDLLPQLKKGVHLTPMLSLSNIFDVKELIKFIKIVSKKLNYQNDLDFCCELKVDGIALNLIYKNGFLVKALTRGNGDIGEDVTINAKKINNIPLVLKSLKVPSLIEIRGEVFISKSDFKELNILQKIEKKRKFSTARNLAAGSLRLIDSKIVRDRKLKFLCHSCGLIKGSLSEVLNHYSRLNELKKWGFYISEYNTICKNSKDIVYFFKTSQSKRNDLDFNIDGIVIKVNSVNYQKMLGFTTQVPRWATSYKFMSEEKSTKIIDVDFQVGRTGLITPVARLEPIKLSGAVIKNVSLHNRSEIEKFKLCIGDTVLVRRSGDVIPYIIKVITSLPNNQRNRIVFPTKCPICNFKIKHSFNNKRSKCTNASCIAQIKLSIFHFFSKQATNVIGIGNKILDKLAQHGKISVLDIYQLNVQKISAVEGLGIISAKKLIYQLERSKHITLDRFIYALGINNVGINTSKNIAMHFKLLQKFVSSNIKELLLIKNVGKVVANSIYKFLTTEKNIMFVNMLINQLGFIILENKPSIKNIHLFNGKNIVITGKLNNFTRSEIRNKLVNLGATINTNVTKKTNIVIVGENPGRNFLKAVCLKIDILKENNLLKLLID